MNGNDQIIDNEQGLTHPLSGQSLMGASKGVITDYGHSVTRALVVMTIVWQLVMVSVMMSLMMSVIMSVIMSVVMSVVMSVMMSVVMSVMMSVVMSVMMAKDAAAIVWRDCPSDQPKLTLKHSNKHTHTHAQTLKHITAGNKTHTGQTVHQRIEGKIVWGLTFA